MNNLDLVSFDTAGLRFKGEINGVRVWHTVDGDGLGLFYFPEPPDIPKEVKSLQDFRSFYREQVAKNGGAIISVDMPLIAGNKAAQVILKFNQKPSGMIYLGSITLPFKNFSFVVKMQFHESGVTGMRESVIMGELLKKKEISIELETKSIKGWMQDAYDPAIAASWDWNKSESEEYDSRFPDHPLSRLRRMMSKIISTLRIEEAIKNEAKFWV
jgi:hypothetical protein